MLIPVAFYCRPVLLSLQEVFGDGGGVEAFSGDGSIGFVFSILEKLGWLLSPRVALSLGVSGSPAVLVASDPVLLARIWPLAIICSGVQRLRCTSCYVPIDVASKPYVASLEACSLRWDSASSCKLSVRSNVEWWLRALATKTTGRSLQGPGCNFYFIQGCLCKDVCVIFYMNQ